MKLFAVKNIFLNSSFHLVPGVRIIKLHDARLKDVLLAEIDYLEQCVEHPFGK